ncbi:MAG: YggT family protein [Anaerolineae bacterium]
MSAIVGLITILLSLFQLILLARVLLSWFPNVDRSSPIIQFIFDMTEPILRPIREILPQTGMFDFSPLVVLVVIQLLMTVLRVF